MYNMNELLREIRRNKERAIRKQAQDVAKAQAKAMTLIGRYMALYELFSDAIYLGQIKSEARALDYVLDVRKARYLEEKISWTDRRELFRLAARQSV